MLLRQLNWGINLDTKDNVNTQEHNTDKITTQVSWVSVCVFLWWADGLVSVDTVLISWHSDNLSTIHCMVKGQVSWGNVILNKDTF